jgi:hypothetical protein
MAKATSKQGKKECPACKTLVGVRTLECKCGHEFPKSKTGKSKSSDKVEVGEVAITALKLGGVNKLKDGLTNLKANSLMDFAIKCGGVDSALKLVSDLEDQL